jgi:hypothetical protein
MESLNIDLRYGPRANPGGRPSQIGVQCRVSRGRERSSRHTGTTRHFYRVSVHSISKAAGGQDAGCLARRTWCGMGGQWGMHATWSGPNGKT